MFEFTFQLLTFDLFILKCTCYVSINHLKVQNMFVQVRDFYLFLILCKRQTLTGIKGFVLEFVY